MHRANSSKTYRRTALFFIWAFVLLLLFLLFNNNRKTSPVENKKVAVVQRDGKYMLLRNQQPFFIKGAGGAANLAAVHRAGGNCIRIWDTTGIDQLLDSAAFYQLAVVAGIHIPNSDAKEFYDDSLKVNAQLAAIQRLVNRTKNHPALLMWCVGNELAFPYRFKFNNFYNGFNAIVAMIHREDPDHPVTTTILDFNKKYIFNLHRRCDVDLLSFNIFNRLRDLAEQRDQFAWFWKGPYLITEWGIDGPWDGTEKTTWGAFIENSSTKKAETYRERYEQSMPVNDAGFLGSCVFYWQQKQEYTHTWFSMMDEYGRPTEAVDAATYLWMGKKPSSLPPQINYLLLDKEGPRKNMIFDPRQHVAASLVMLKRPQTDSVTWEIYPEDWYKENGHPSTKRPPLLERVQAGLDISFETPAVPGPYRIFATIADRQGRIATANFPFYVVSPE
ncbi:MAG: hypothetical protein JWQ27_2499 [Ferruginibacter sp.]|nr:hypothetical protein [Ferruginibacter sp.]